MTDITYSETVDRIARAIHASRDGAHNYRKYKSDPRIAEAYRKDAAAALSTILDILREPTVPCIEAGAKAMIASEGKEVDGADNWRALAAFRAMLTASPLQEGK